MQTVHSSQSASLRSLVLGVLKENVYSVFNPPRQGSEGWDLLLAPLPPAAGKQGAVSDGLSVSWR